MRLQLDRFNFERKYVSIEDLLVYCTETDCSDLYIKVGEKPYISRYGKIIELNCREITRDIFQTWYSLYVSNELNATYVREKFLDLSCGIRIPEDSPNYYKLDDNVYRYRVNLSFSSEKNTATFRMIKPKTLTFDNVNLDKQLKEVLEERFAEKSKILVVTGVTGSGKSTTLASCINTFMQKGKCLDNAMILTFEDPIENIFHSTDTSRIVQKELRKDFRNYPNGIMSALREHPTHVLLGEIRDTQTVNAALEMVKTGHSCYTTFHSSSVSGTISRMLFHLENQTDLKYDLLMHLNMILAQKLVPNDNGYLVDYEYLIFTEEVVKRLIESLDSDKNMAVEVEKLMNDEDLIARKIVKRMRY